MKRLLMLTVLAAVTAATVGCGCGGWFRRGPRCEVCPTVSPCVPAPTVSSGAVGETYLPAPG